MRKRLAAQFHRNQRCRGRIHRGAFREAWIPFAVLSVSFFAFEGFADVKTGMGSGTTPAF